MLLSPMTTILAQFHSSLGWPLIITHQHPAIPARANQLPTRVVLSKEARTWIHVGLSKVQDQVLGYPAIAGNRWEAFLKLE